MPRRATYIKEVLAENPKAILIDTGNLCGNDESQPPVVFRALKMMGYTAVGMGASDLKFLDIFVKTAKAEGVQIVHVGSEDIRGVLPYLVKKVGSVRVGILGLGAVEQNDDAGDIDERRIKAFQEARKKSDVLIVIDKAGVTSDAWLQENAENAPDLVIGSERMLNVTEVTSVGKTQFLPSSKEARRIGVLKIEMLADKQLKADYTSQHLTDAVAEDADVRKLIDDYYQTQREEQQKKALEIEAAVRAARAAQQASSGMTEHAGPYFDSKSCAPCHRAEYDSWAASKHAKAVETLERENALRPDCLICHSERYRKITTDITRDTQYKQGVECASCHMGVLPHGKDGPPKSDSPKMDLNNCRICHTKERSAEFEDHHKEYWEKAKHKPVSST